MTRDTVAGLNHDLSRERLWEAYCTACAKVSRLEGALRDIGLTLGIPLDPAVKPVPSAKEWREIAEKALAIKRAALEEKE